VRSLHEVVQTVLELSLCDDVERALSATERFSQDSGRLTIIHHCSAAAFVITVQRALRAKLL